MKWLNIVRIVLIAFYAFLWIGGVTSYVLMGGPPEEMAWSAPLLLALAGGLLLVFAPASERPVLLIAGLVGFGAEILGVKTGFPFGAYAYTTVLFPHLFGVPLVLIAAWLILFSYVRQMVTQPLAGAAWMTAIDLVIDPLAAHSLGFWEWEQGGWYYDIPWTNFAGWFFVCLLLFLLFRRPAEDDPQARWFGLSIILFFTIIAVGTGLFLAGAVGIALLILHGGWRYRTGCRSLQRASGDGSPTPNHEPGA